VSNLSRVGFARFTGDCFATPALAGDAREELPEKYPGNGIKFGKKPYNKGAVSVLAS
jgi:hypothetical protein